jgi:hypothetical protein
MEGVVSREPCLTFADNLWRMLVGELHRRTAGVHESGAFLLGVLDGTQRHVREIVYYDDLDRRAYDTGVVMLHGDAFARLWDVCATRALAVVGDVHVHALGAGQSRADRENPMIARSGHLAMILPRFARPPIRRWSIGIYEYLGNHQWQAHGGYGAARILNIVADERHDNG